MNSQHFFWIYLTGGIVFLILFLSGRRNSRQPTKLNLKAGGAPAPEALQLDANMTVASSRSVSPPPSLSSRKHEDPPIDSQIALRLPVNKPSMEIMEPLGDSKAGKNLNCFFMYNGHDWDAYLVLGVPAGSTLPAVTQAYQDLIKKSDPNSYEFFEAAYQAILKSTQGYRL